MLIELHKLSGDRHALEIVREDGRRERVECETRSYLVHDLLHYAVEAEARLDAGFWGTLASGKTLAELNDRTGAAMAGSADALADIEPDIEPVVGFLSGVTKGRTAAELVSLLAQQGHLSGRPVPPWLTEAFVDNVRERFRRLVGQWNATPYRGTMRLEWPPDGR